MRRDDSALARRTFLGFAASLLGETLAACGGDSAPSAQAGNGGGAGAAGAAAAHGGAGAAGGASVSATDVPWGLYDELVAAVRASPDHLPARAEELAAGRDPSALFAFVRDTIMTVLPVDRAVNVETWVRGGTRAVLRTGVGTPREKAELLVALYKQAGLDAVVVSGRLNDPSGVRQAVLAQQTAQPFTPAADDATIARWRAAMGRMGTPAPVEAFDEHGVASAALAQPILAALPLSARQALRSKADDLTSSIPLVRVMIDGQAKYANPLVPSAVFGDANTMATPQIALEADSYALIMVTLSASTTSAPANRAVLVQRTWAADEMVGRQLRVQFRPTADLDLALRAPARDLHTFVPALSLTSPELDADAMAKLSAAGPALTIAGDVLAPASDGSILLDGARVTPPAPNASQEAASIASIFVDVSAQAYPDIRLRVSALDASGAPVSGLPANAFLVDEDGVSAGIQLRANQAPRPNVVIILDASGSIPAEYASPMSRAALASGIAASILVHHPDAAFQVIAVSGGSVPTPDGFTLRTADAVGAAASKVDSFGSGIWAAVRDASLAFPAVIVLVTDGQSDEMVIDGFRSDVAHGAPIVAAAVGKANLATMDDIARLSGGVRLLPNAPSEVASAAATLLDHRRAQPYVMHYTAPPKGAAMRVVRVRAAGNAVAGEATYEVPPVEQQTTAPALASIALTVGVGFDPPVTRILAGYASDSSPGPGAGVDRALLEEVRGQLLGSTLLSIETAAPTFSVWLEDVLRSRLAAKPFWQATKMRDATAIVGALSQAAPYLPSVLSSLHPPLLSDDAAVTYDDAFRFVLYTERPRFGGARRRSVDFLSSCRSVTASPDAATSFATTLARTARLALAEAQVLPTSTVSLLSGHALSGIAAGVVTADALAFLPMAKREAWAALLNTYASFHRVVPTSGEPMAFWAIEPATGSLLGVLADGTGGSFANDVECQINDAQSLMSLIGLFGGLAGFGAIGVWEIFAKVVAANVLRASVYLDTLDVPDNYDQQFYDSAETAACDLVKSALAAGVPSLSGLATIDGIADVLHHAMPCGFNTPDSGKLC